MVYLKNNFPLEVFREVNFCSYKLKGTFEYIIGSLNQPRNKISILQ